MALKIKEQKREEENIKFMNDYQKREDLKMIDRNMGISQRNLK